MKTNDEIRAAVRYMTTTSSGRRAGVKMAPWSVVPSTVGRALFVSDCAPFAVYYVAAIKVRLAATQVDVTMYEVKVNYYEDGKRIAGAQFNWQTIGTRRTRSEATKAALEHFAGLVRKAETEANR